MTLTKQTLLERRDNEQKWTEGKLSLNHGTDMMERGTEGRRQVENSMKEREYKQLQSLNGVSCFSI